MTLRKGSRKTHHFRNEVSEYAIIHHKKKIIERIAERLDDVKEIPNKNYFMLSGTYEGKKITLITTGMGAGNTGIVVDQAIAQGARYIIKLGTFGALQEDIRIGDIYLPTGAVRAEGMTDAYAPIYYPAVPDGKLHAQTARKAEELRISIEPDGIVHSVNIYSPYYEETPAPDKYSPDKYHTIGVFGVEMETSAAFVCSSTKGASCVALLICNREWKTQQDYRDGKEADWDKHQQVERKNKATDDSIKLILETIKEL